MTGSKFALHLELKFMQLQSRYTIAIIVTALYLLPILFLSSYSMVKMPVEDSWEVFSLGLLMGLCGSLLLFLLLRNWEIFIRSQSLQPGTLRVPLQGESGGAEVAEIEDMQTLSVQESLLVSHAKQAQLQNELDLRNEEFQQMCQEREVQLHQSQSVVQELERIKNGSQETLKQKELLIREHSKTISEQQAMLEQQQQQIVMLEGKENDLHYEIKTLLQLAKNL